MSNIIKDLKSLAVSLDRLTILENNPRKGDVNAIKKSYQTFGQRKPIVVRKTGVNNAGELVGEILAGNHQYQAAKNLGWTEIAVVWVEDDDSTASAYAIADNRIGLLGEWDLEKLIVSLQDLNYDLLNAASFDLDEVDDMRALFEESQIESDKIKKSLNEVDPVNDFEEKMKDYIEKSSRMIIFDYEIKDYIIAVELFSEHRKQRNLESNSEVLLAILKEHKKEKEESEGLENE
jgi:ParB-like chromosome segregation protein Spo0J